MKQLFSFTAACLFAVNIYSQNIGIGTTTPLYKLDVRGSINTDSLYRIGGNAVLLIDGSQNIFVGVGSGPYITTGGLNTGIGYQSLLNNNAGDGNVACGYYSLQNNRTGDWNTACGLSALNSNSTGSSNTAQGINALFSNSSGSYNTAIGASALYEARTSLSHYNTAVGASSLLKTTNSQYNTAIGYHAGTFQDNGYNNVFIGANTDVNASGLFNVIAMGQGTTVTSGSSTARFGNSATVSYGGWAGWSNISDGRFKKNVNENIPGLDFINKLRPISYQLAATELDAFLHKSGTNQMSAEAMQVHARALIEKENITYSGFIAQEVEAIAKQLGFDFSGVDAPRNADDTYGLRYAEFVVPLVKAVQELSKQNDELLKRIEKLELTLSRKTGN